MLDANRKQQLEIPVHTFDLWKTIKCRYFVVIHKVIILLGIVKFSTNYIQCKLKGFFYVFFLTLNKF